jgi:hypothetical protein
MRGAAPGEDGVANERIDSQGRTTDPTKGCEQQEEATRPRGLPTRVPTTATRRITQQHTRECCLSFLFSLSLVSSFSPSFSRRFAVTATRIGTLLYSQFIFH